MYPRTVAERAQIEIARLSDAPVIADMSRRLVEHGLVWRWTPAAIRRCIRHAETECVIVRAKTGHPIGFGIMRYELDVAHLILLAVSPGARRRRLATQICDHLEAMARTAGIEAIQVEVRSSNLGARSFYKARGYADTEHLGGYYQGKEDAQRMVVRLWVRADLG